jgi:multidrug efflux system outer membrane protein
VSEAQWEEFKATYLQAAVNAFREVADALAAHRYQRELRTAREQQVAHLTRAISLAEDRYRGGVADYLELLTAQQDLFAAELQLAQAQGDQLVALAQLYRALGGGWTTETQ